MHTQHLQRVRTSGHQLGNRPAYPEACHQTQIFLQAVAFPQDWLHHVQESAPLSQARERPRDHQPFLPVALMFEKRPDLYNTTHGPPVALPVIRGLVWGRSLLHSTACRNHTHKPLLAELRPSFQTLPPLPPELHPLSGVCLPSHPPDHCTLCAEL